MTGQQLINDLAVADLRAIGLPIAPTLINHNPNSAIGWFGLTDAMPVASGITLGAICLSLLLFGLGALRRTARLPFDRKD